MEYIVRVSPTCVVARGDNEEEALKDAIRVMREFGWLRIGKKEN